MKSKIPKSISETLNQIHALALVNPFTLERVQLEAQLFNQPTVNEPLHFHNASSRSIVDDLIYITRDCLESLRSFLNNPGKLSSAECERIRIVIWFLLYHQHITDFQTILDKYDKHDLVEKSLLHDVFQRFKAGLNQYLQITDSDQDQHHPLVMSTPEVAEFFAFCFQLWRGYSGIFRRIIGRSPAMSQLRAELWEVIFTRRLFWSFEYLKERMANFSTLILGDSGTGKELVAEVIGESQFIPYHPKVKQFAVNPASCFNAVNLSALSPNLIESELFGHTKGAYTGAEQARKGMLEQCPPYGILFLDEIGELNPEIQIKLLRVLQTRTFQPVGSGTVKSFQGRIVSATNRDIDELIDQGDMRKDFLYRVGSIVIRTPNLAQRFKQNERELDDLLQHLVNKTLGRFDETIFNEQKRQIQTLIQQDYSWPGNVRELEQCVRSLLVKSTYTPLLSPGSNKGDMAELFNTMETAPLPLEDIITAYCRHIVNQTGSYQAAARILDTDWRTVKKYASKP